MYEVLIKNHEPSSCGYQKIGKQQDYKNALESATDIVFDLIGYFNGHTEEKDYFMDEHPTTTINTPKFYCVAETDVFRIYEHYKENGWIFSEHVYPKRFTVKIIKSGERKFEVDSEYQDLKRIDLKQKQKMNSLIAKMAKIFRTLSEKQLDITPSTTLEMDIEESEELVKSDTDNNVFNILNGRGKNVKGLSPEVENIDSVVPLDTSRLI